jgi:hypothetical protein
MKGDDGRDRLPDSCKTGKHSHEILGPRVLVLVFLFLLETWIHYVAQSGLEPAVILLPQPPENLAL